ncbi:hypothetical protein M2436_006780 [Streptomyces sp. HB372]|nr:hypothetical protein [Streptomyces sp. HB372]
MSRNRIALSEVLAAAEEAAPVDSLDVVARNLRTRFSARYVSFLFVDVVGRRLLRVNNATVALPEEDRAEQVPLAGSSMYATTCSAPRKSSTQRKERKGGGYWHRSLTAVTPSVCWSCSSTS